MVGFPDADTTPHIGKRDGGNSPQLFIKRGLGMRFVP